jgi:hypothetical protein
MHSIDRDQEKLPSPPQPFNFCCIQSNQSRSRLFLKNGRTSLRFPCRVEVKMHSRGCLLLFSYRFSVTVERAG